MGKVSDKNEIREDEIKKEYMVKVKYLSRFCCEINKGVEEPPPFFRNLKEHLHIFSKSIFISLKNLSLSLQILLGNILIPYLFYSCPKEIAFKSIYATKPLSPYNIKA